MIKHQDLLDECLKKYEKEHPGKRFSFSNPYCINFYMFFVNKNFNKLYKKLKDIKK